MYKKKNKKILLCVVIFSCFILASIFINRNYNIPDFFIKDGILFVDRFITKPFQSFSDEEYEKLRIENENLKKQIDEIKYHETENEELIEEIRKLKELVNINKTLSDKEYINASVLTRGIDYWNESLTIDKGKNEGIENNMAVVSGGSLIGITSNVSHYNSNVLLLCNAKFPINISVKIKLEGSEVYGILNNYNNDHFEIMGIVENVTIPKGAKVVTTGLGNLFPSGILVGYVDDVVTDNFDLSKIVNVKSNTNFDDISYVSIVKRDDK